MARRVSCARLDRSDELPSDTLVAADRLSVPTFREQARSRGRPGAPAAPAEGPPRVPSVWGDRLYVLLVVTAATAVAAWIVTRALILRDGGSAP